MSKTEPNEPKKELSKLEPTLEPALPDGRKSDSEPFCELDEAADAVPATVMSEAAVKLITAMVLRTTVPFGPCGGAFPRVRPGPSDLDAQTIERQPDDVSISHK